MTKPEPVGPGTWGQHAACHGINMAEPETSVPKYWYMEVNQRKTICAGCPVQPECETWALAHPDPAVGMIAGGHTTKERLKIRKRR